jgi:hypothetical protein
MLRVEGLSTCRRVWCAMTIILAHNYICFYKNKIVVVFLRTLALNLSEVPIVPLGLIYMCGSVFPFFGFPRLSGAHFLCLRRYLLFKSPSYGLY